MNTRMLESAAVMANLATLRARGVRFLEPDEGRLACGDVGAGRLPDTADADGGARGRRSKGGRTGRCRACRVLITAGPTREAIDPVRFVSNPSSGRMGYALAAEAAARGAARHAGERASRAARPARRRGHAA